MDIQHRHFSSSYSTKQCNKSKNYCNTMPALRPISTISTQALFPTTVEILNETSSTTDNKLLKRVRNQISNRRPSSTPNFINFSYNSNNSASSSKQSISALLTIQNHLAKSNKGDTLILNCDSPPINFVTSTFNEQQQHSQNQNEPKIEDQDPVAKAPGQGHIMIYRETNSRNSILPLAQNLSPRRLLKVPSNTLIDPLQPVHDLKSDYIISADVNKKEERILIICYSILLVIYQTIKP